MSAQRQGGVHATETDPSNRTRKSGPAIGTALTGRLSAGTVFETAAIDHAAILFTPHYSMNRLKLTGKSARMRGACDERHGGGVVAGLRLQGVWRAARHPTIESGIDGWRSTLQRLAYYLHQLRQDGVLRTRNPDDPDHDVALTPPPRRDVTTRTDPYRGQGRRVGVESRRAFGSTDAHLALVRAGRPWLL
jgi:hypothetical protein